MERSTVVRVKDGLHARPAARFVKLAKSFESDINLVKGEKSVSAKSTVKLMLLGVKENEELTVQAEGADAVEALEALIAFLDDPMSGLEEEPAAVVEAEATPPAEKPAAQAAAPEGGIKGVAASEGVHIGPVFAHFPKQIEPLDRKLAADQIAPALAQFQAAVAAVQERMDRSLREDNLAASDKGIVSALREIAGDETLIEDSENAIRNGVEPVGAVIAAASQLSAQFSQVDDPYLRARADDVSAVGRQICLALLGEEDVSLDRLPKGSVLIAEDIGAWDLARADLKSIGAIVCGHGAATSHIAIIARTHGIPAVLGLGKSVHDLAGAKTVAVDGDKGVVFPDPDAAVAARFEETLAKANAEKEALRIYRDLEPTLDDGTVIEVAANLGATEEIEAAQEAGAMGIGLFRTELLFMRHTHLPSEDMQYDVYKQLVEAFPKHSVIVRTLDIGGDKPIAGIEFPSEENPFLGWRGIRMCLERPDMFKMQLRALLRAAVHGNLKVMLPMISTVDEIERTERLIEECRQELKEKRIAFGDFALGVMIETPAAVLIAPMLAKKAAFFSIGTNDLTQYIMAADRLNPAVAGLNDVTNPAVMAAIEMVAKAGRQAGIMVGMCGEAAGRPDLIPEFVRFGLTELSMSPASIPRAKRTLSELGKKSAA
ncbi:phosphoenolpyruvate--protein phosphotransferase [Limoniibacter endophyticus]|uniref:Phosphoenolpyruvate-protein phosphotransferase n=1 Tax=Limoniibacter endophyticus TaxID=1565040 RepID=A0A8J3DJX4_9HYPH|nr:phosphoenolpyruvate--protein phosphotransferase [Limoniibacter endophyticus]GHC74986.1 phosphoenolpyruvate-protein phosphotransferase [Limoniibacter endophyticus]